MIRDWPLRRRRSSTKSSRRSSRWSRKANHQRGLPDLQRPPRNHPSLSQRASSRKASHDGTPSRSDARSEFAARGLTQRAPGRSRPRAWMHQSPSERKYRRRDAPEGRDRSLGELGDLIGKNGEALPHLFPHRGSLTVSCVPEGVPSPVMPVTTRAWTEEPGEPSSSAITQSGPCALSTASIPAAVSAPKLTSLSPKSARNLATWLSRRPMSALKRST
jgi:hypothetical protein